MIQGQTRDIEGTTCVIQGLTFDDEGTTRVIQGLTCVIEGTTCVDRGLSLDNECLTCVNWKTQNIVHPLGKKGVQKTQIRVNIFTFRAVEVYI